MRQALLRFIRALPLLLLTPVLLLIAALGLAAADLAWLIFGKRRLAPETKPETRAASLVIPNWNGKDLLERFLPSWLAAIANHPGSEVIVVDNGSDDGSAAWIRTHYPGVRVLALAKNFGFGGGSNAGFNAAKNDVVVLLNSDMRVEADFLQPLLDGFTDEKVFAVSCQIFLGDRAKRREETGLTEGWWEDGALRVSHREDPAVDRPFPCFYGGGGSCAFDRRKFLELGGFDELLSPFYLEDTDLGYLAWKRGWKVLYQPRSVVHHEHRGTIGKKFSDTFIRGVLQKNFLLFVWKNIHSFARLSEHLFFAQAGAIATAWSGEAPTRTSGRGIFRAARQLGGAIGSRWRARTLAVIHDAEAFRRTRPAYFHDRFSRFEPSPARPRVLFVSPYSICPPNHGGGLFMYGTLRELARTCEVHAIVMLDYESEREPNEELRQWCKTVEFYVRPRDNNPHLGSLIPHAVHEFRSARVEWLIQRQTLLHCIDVLQLEYTALGQYGHEFRNLVCALFEHDVYFQSVGSQLPYFRGPLKRGAAAFEYVRAIRFELGMLPKYDLVEVCTEENRDYVTSFLPELAPRVASGLRAGIETGKYKYPGGPREPRTMLFLGSFRHTPNLVALQWFVQHVLPLVVEKIPDVRLLVAGAEPPPLHSLPNQNSSIDLMGFVEDIEPLFATSALFVCPIRSGSGVRVKLLEAFASGIPVVSTHLGAEGLARVDGEFCALADDPADFADKLIYLLDHPNQAADMAQRARAEVEANWDMARITDKLVERYCRILENKRAANASHDAKIKLPARGRALSSTVRAADS